MSVFTKETLINGKPAQIECLEIGGQIYSLSRGLVTTAHLEDEWYEDVRDPALVIAELKQSSVRADIFTFWQRLPETDPQYAFYMEWEPIAALQITSFEHWWSQQLRSETRTKIRKAQKTGLVVREATYDDEFVRGMTAIFNEAPIRQGRRFWHYGKDFETVKRQFSRYLFREDLLGAYYGGELIGFIMLANAGRYAVPGQIISMMRHRDKAPTNALIAKAVEVCEQKRLPYLTYGYWGEGSLIDFKRANGFVETNLPRYYIPLTPRGQLAIRTGLHRGWKELLPAGVKVRLKTLRSRWLSLMADA